MTNEALAWQNAGMTERLWFENQSKNFKDENPWPPRQFKCGRCGKQYDGLATCKSDCASPGGFVHDVLIMDFCTHCGESFSPYDGRHTCTAYGKHARCVNPDAATYFVRVTSFGDSRGKHHYDSDKPIQFVAVRQMLLRHSGNQEYIRWTTVKSVPKPKAIAAQKVWDRYDEKYDEDDYFDYY